MGVREGVLTLMIDSDFGSHPTCSERDQMNGEGVQENWRKKRRGIE